ncbi:TIGR03087 family PEP-CTERM/XrtA system glycosyltransferase [Rhodopirellula sp. SWK7]|uniref:TIGR03087 family PEP-CTERM/XrtA system glycosyltransferase n=1 Tax=Rhodopirellula sp. SWK7 TaxID=595460 RepID=UPI0002BD7F7F|nr:TIGR03087 family PEP-CTERM/XrtA system glycosyltransferase [Rhodopirellula sp. SWK7]EMI44597.1 glycosyl transferase, group 1 [Rhodopirellula sp. SWK7]
MSTALASSKRVLMLTHRFPYPPNRGDRIRSYNLLRVLSQRFRMTLGCTADEAVAVGEREHLASLCDEVFVADLAPYRRLASAGKSVVFGGSLTEGMFASNALSRQVVDWHAERPFDAVLIFCSSMFPHVDNKAFAGTPKIVDLVDVDSLKWQQMSRESRLLKRLVYAIESRRVQKLEQRIAEQATAVALVSDSEAELFRLRVNAKTPVFGISNGVDTDYFRPAMPRPISPSPRLPLSPTSRPLRLVFTGVLDYRPNVEGLLWFCRQVMPQMRGRLDVQLSIVGRRPCRQVFELGTLPGVTVVGEVPDVRPSLHNADIAISPLKLARGIQNKVLEAMACGLPVVLTPQSAEGIDAESGKEFWIADSVDQWCGALAELAADSNRRQSMGEAARNLVKAEYSWSARMADFVSVIDSQFGPEQSASSLTQLAGIS